MTKGKGKRRLTEKETVEKRIKQINKMINRGYLTADRHSKEELHKDLNDVLKCIKTGLDIIERLKNSQGGLKL